MKLERIVLAGTFDPSKLVTNHEIFSKKSTTILDNGVQEDVKEFSDDGLFSPRIFGDMDSKEDYGCPCGHLHGKFYEGTICPKCGKPVEFIGLNINKSGWIDLSLDTYNENGTIATTGNGCHIIEYIPYAQLEKIIGRDNLRSIISVHNTITLSGDVDKKELDSLRSASPESKYYYIGVEEFYQRYNEVLDYYYNIRGNKNTDMYNFLQNKNEIFTDKIPVISVILRPAMRTEDGLKLDDINIKYQSILKNLEILKDINTIKIIRDSTLEEIQAEFMQLSEEILDAIKGKEGLIRSQICGTRINFSARNIITPAKAGYKIDEVVLPYITFLELYKFEIINIIRVTENISIKQAENVWYNATLGYNEKVYLIMKKMITDNEVGVLINRRQIAAL